MNEKLVVVRVFENSKKEAEAIAEKKGMKQQALYSRIFKMGLEAYKKNAAV